MTTTEPAPVLAIFCGAEHPITWALCRRVACDGNHQIDDGTRRCPSPPLTFRPTGGPA